MEPGVCVQVCLCEYCVYLQGKSTTFCDAFNLHSGNPANTLLILESRHVLIHIHSSPSATNQAVKKRERGRKKKEWVQTDTLGKKKRRDQIKDSDGYIHINVCGV